MVRVEGRLTVTAADEVEKVTDVTSVELFALPQAPWAPRLLYLAHLRDGWLDGHGRAPSYVALDAARHLLMRLQERKELGAMPGVSPTEEGGIQLGFRRPSRLGRGDSGLPLGSLWVSHRAP